MIDPAWKFWYRSQHERRCRSDGEEFEKYVDSILRRHHKDYLNPEPMGSKGDGGCDGVADGGSVLYACYGQRAVTDLDRKTRDKIVSDFQKAYASWTHFSTWRFVSNAPLGTAPTKALMELRDSHGPSSSRPISLEYWGAPDDLWWNAVSKLSADHLDEVLPGVPKAQDVRFEDLVELINSLESVAGPVAEDFRPINRVPATKMDFNGLPRTTRAEFDEGRQLATRIDEWFNRHADPTLRDSKATTFAAIYQEARSATDDVREIVNRIYVAVAGQDFASSTPRANAVYAITAYFFDSCDIFEEPPQHDLEVNG